MTPFLPKRLLPGATALALIAATSLGLVSCSGSSGSSSNEPAPQTMNGIVLSLYSGGPTFTFVAASGDAMGGTEFGAFTMAPQPTGFPAVTEGGVSFEALVAESVTGGAYEYRRTAPESGVLILRGFGISPPPEIGDPPRYLQGDFDRTYNILFATSGATISGLNVADTDNIPDGFYSSLVFTSSTVRLFGGGPVPVGWTMDRSTNLNLPKVYPATVSGELLEVRPDGEEAIPMDIYLLESSFTRFLTGVSSSPLIEEGGVGRLEMPDEESITINYSYRPVISTVDQVELTITGEDISFTLIMNFTDFQAGNYTQGDGAAGTFRFPFIDGSI